MAKADLESRLAAKAEALAEAERDASTLRSERDSLRARTALLFDEMSAGDRSCAPQPRPCCGCCFVLAPLLHCSPACVCVCTGPPSLVYLSCVPHVCQLRPSFM